jgi:hypothetical protein
MSCCSACAGGHPCDCCTGIGATAPARPRNRAGLAALRYRAGTYATFLDAMLARLSSADLPPLASLRTREPSDPSIALLDAWAVVADILTFYQERIANEGYLRTAGERRSILELARLIGYAPRPGVAATVYLAYTIDKGAAPVAIGVGAKASSVPGPGESMQTFETADALAARVEWNTLVPRQTEPQTAASISKQGLYLKGAALNLKVNDPLLIDIADGKGPQLRWIDEIDIDAKNNRTRVVLRAITATLQPQALVREIAAHFSRVEAFDVSPDAAMTKRVLALLDEAATVATAAAPADLQHHLETVAVPKLKAELETAHDRHFTKLAPWIADILIALHQARAVSPATPRNGSRALGQGGDDFVLGEAIATLKLPPTVPPPGPQALTRSVGQAFRTSADTLPRMLASLQPALQKTFYAVYRGLPPAVATTIEVDALRVSAAPFGHNAPLRLTDVSNGKPIFDEWQIDDPWNGPASDNPNPVLAAAGAITPEHHEPNVLFLDNDYNLSPSSTIVIAFSSRPPLVVTRADAVQARSLAAYGLSGKTMRIALPQGQAWFKDLTEPFTTVRTTRVFAGSERLELAEVPIDGPVAGVAIELDGLYEDLEPGRWLVVTGERADLLGPDGTPLPGVQTGELVMLAAVEQRRRTQTDGTPVAGDRVHTFLTLATPLAFAYRRTSVSIYGNVVRATHGETVQEVLGSGDAATPWQRFTLKRSPLTYVSAPTVSGVSSTLQVRVNDVLWHEAPSLASLTGTDRAFITRTDDDAKTTAVFGNGERGARLPTGTENVKATYRSGLGKGGNVAAAQISLLTTQTPGVKAVINPLRASGGADKEERDSARRNAPLAVASLDRLVSTRDYADFARTFAGVGKAAAARLSDGRRQVVHVTIAGADDIPIEVSSDLYRNLLAALHRYGDPYVPITLDVRERLALVISAKVKVVADFAWESVEPRIRAALLDIFGFARIDLGRDLLLSTAIATIQRVTGVAYVDVVVFDAISEAQLIANFTKDTPATLARRERLIVEDGRVDHGVIAPAQIAYLTPDVPDTLILQEITS